jgi:Ca2+-binding RTX toxin-like protein
VIYICRGGVRRSGDIIGNNGANTLNGRGNDTLHSLRGADVFQFTAALGSTNVDRILDFQVSVDKIAPGDAIFTGLNPDHWIRTGL